MAALAVTGAVGVAPSAGTAMNVCMLVYNVCQTDPRVAKEARTLAALGHRVTVIALLDEGSAGVEERDGYTIMRINRDPVHRRLLRRLPQLLRNRQSSRPHSAASPNVESRLAASAPSWIIGLHRLLMLLDYYLKAYRLTKTLQVDRVHAHDLLTLPAGVLAARQRGARLIYDAHELYPELGTLSARERRVWAVVERLLIRRADRVITVCESIRDELRRRHGVDATVLLNVPPYHDPPAARTGALRRHAGLGSPNDRVILYTGGFMPHRGLEALIAAAAAFQDGVLVMMGWGRLEPELRALVKSLHLADRVRIVEPVAPIQVLAYTAEADIGAIPYIPMGLNNLYATPNKLFEFISAGLPIVSSRLPELRRFVEGERVGVTVDPGSPAAIAAAVNRLLADEPLREAMRARALAAARRLCWEYEAPKLARLYSGESA